MSLFTDATLVLSLTANAGMACALAHLLDRRRKPSTPRAARRTPHADKQVTVHHLPPVPVEYLPAQVKPDDGDKTEVRTKVTDTRVIKESPFARWRNQ